MKQIRSAFKALFYALVFWLCWGSLSTAAQSARIFAAASLIDVLTELSIQFEAETGDQIVLVTGASSTMARQILAGAPADGFISASKDYAELVAQDLDFELTPLFSNSLVLASRANFPNFKIEELPNLVVESRLVMGDPSHVPAGQYAQQALLGLGVWDAFSDSLIFAHNVRAALHFASSGAADFAIVYGSDVLNSNLNVILQFDAQSHDPIMYWGVAVNAQNDVAAQFFTFLQSDAGQKVLVGFGFEEL